MMTHVLLMCPTLQEKYGVAIVLSQYRLYNLCVTVIKHSINPKRIKVTDEPKDKNDMQVRLAKVLIIKNSVEFLKWNEEKVLPYQLTDNFISYEVIR